MHTTGACFFTGSTLLFYFLLIVVILYAIQAISNSLETAECKYCKMKISRNAQICAFCRKDNPINKKQVGHYFVKIFIALLVFYGVFYAVSPNKNATTPAESKAQSSTPNALTQQNNSKQANTPDVVPALKEQKNSDGSQNGSGKSNVIYKGKDKHGATVYSDKPMTDNE